MLGMYAVAAARAMGEKDFLERAPKRKKKRPKRPRLKFGGC